MPRVTHFSALKKKCYHENNCYISHNKWAATTWLLFRMWSCSKLAEIVKKTLFISKYSSKYSSKCHLFRKYSSKCHSNLSLLSCASSLIVYCFPFPYLYWHSPKIRAKEEKPHQLICIYSNQVTDLTCSHFPHGHIGSWQQHNLVVNFCLKWEHEIYLKYGK